MWQFRWMGRLLLWGCVWAPPANAQSTPPVPNEFSEASLAETFERDVRPLLLENCSGCHSKSVGKVMGGLSMDSRQDLLTGGDSGPAIRIDAPNESLLLQAARRESFEMPPDQPLDSRQLAILEKWVGSGAFWPSVPAASEGEVNWLSDRIRSHWSWQPLSHPAVPAPLETAAGEPQDWPRGPIDAFILQKLKLFSLRPGAPAAPEQLLRRLSLDLTGLPPTIEQQEQFQRELSIDDSLAIEQAVERLMASPQFGVHWGRHWLDLMRYAETLGHEFDYPIRHAWQYRDAIVDALNVDLDYRRMITDHLAGDLVVEPRMHPTTDVNQSLAMTAWWWLGDSVHAPVDIKSDWATRIENQIDVLSKSFLGMTVACARCHDHKFDAIRMEDYYGLVGTTSSLRRRYAVTDPHDRIANHLDLISKELKQATTQLHQAWNGLGTESVERWLAAALDHWQTLSPAELELQLPASSPLYPLRLLLVDAGNGASQLRAAESTPLGTDVAFATRLSAMREKLGQAAREYEQWLSASPLVADFRSGLPEGWTLEAVQPQDSVADEIAADWFSDKIPRPIRSDVFQSARLGRQQHLTLRSPTLEVTHPVICLQLRGKSTQSSIVVSNYFMGEFHGLLFGDLRKPIDQPLDGGWVCHAGDLNKYLGHPAFISLENEAGAWFELSQVRMADRPPPETTNRWAQQLLSTECANTREFRSAAVQSLYQAIRTSWATESSAESDDFIDVTRAVLGFVPSRLLGSDVVDRLHRQTDKLQQLDRRAPEPTLLLASAEGTPVDAAVQVRGNPHQLSASVPRGCLHWQSTWPTVPENSSGRMEIAQSLTDPRHPLTARVMVNRIWHHLLGEGLVSSTDNFGVLGSRPSHPELLDWLAAEFIEQGWSTKWLIRQIVTSRTYALGSRASQESREVDPNGQLYSFRPVRRLSAETLRDSILLTCGTLDPRLGGQSVPVHLTDQMTGRGRPVRSGPLDGDGRRSIYLEIRRNFLNPFLLVFDFPMPSSCVGRRNRSNLPSQSLTMLNDPLMVDMSQRWVLATEEIRDSEQRIRLMFRGAMSRHASHEELETCRNLVEEMGSLGWQALAHTLLNAKAFQFVQ